MYAGKQTVALYKINNNNTNKKLMISFGGRSFIKAQISQCQSINKKSNEILRSVGPHKITNSLRQIIFTLTP